ncbi:uncharacterized protein PV09_05632 [Verruconis gallopava]|uniref:MHD domain-containing protein n=1 Tax=Verruconis gallopava TaxID=253628 RepID=A0A0D1XKW5_9PEZI|nr:uncharacterized protein PV09_05632 [Verruconis gallopava]KIW02971.1 hypothetical protein PV09_05632 [Verruconis gallopava]
MDLQRQDYPAMLDKLQPLQAVNLLSDRLKYINRLNVDVAEWLLERRRIEETYATSLRKLAARGFKDSELSDLGIFQIPWQKMINSIEGVASAHYGLAQSIGSDVEVPLREWASKDRDMVQMTNMVGNIHAIAKELESAQKKSEKLSSKGGKADAGKVANASSEVENALQQWKSQAPFVFERLQAVDEARVDNMRDLLTQYQTSLIEAGSALSESAEDSLNALLNMQTADEIKTFVMKTTKTLPQSQRRLSMRQEHPPPSTTDASSSLAPVSSVPRDDGSSHRSNSFQDRPERPPITSEKSSEKGSKFGLKRLGTVIARRRQSTNPYAQSRSPERKKSSSDVRSPFGRFARKEHSHQPLETVPSPPRTANSGFEETPASRSSNAPPQMEPLTNVTSDGTNGTNLETVHEQSTMSEPVNGTANAPVGVLQEPLQPSSVTYEPPKDEHGFTIPPPSHRDPMQQALAEAAEVNESQPQFKVDIKNAPIQEDSGDTSAAFAKFGNALQSQTQPRRSMGTIRNRRDRNTIMIPNGQSIPELPKDPALATPPGSAPLPAEASSPAAGMPIEPVSSTTTNAPMEVATAAVLSLPSPPLVAAAPSTDTSVTVPSQMNSPNSQTSPFKMPHRSTLALEDHTSSDTHSIRSGRSLGSTVSTTVRHPDMHEPGLNSSFVETINAVFSDGKVTRASLVGEIGLSFNPTDLDAPFGTEIIRLENLGANDKLAPNPAFIDAVPGKVGHFSVDLGQITKTQVAFKYQVHITPEEATSRMPLLLQSQWRIDSKQADCRVSYSLNPSYPFESLTFSDLAIVIQVNISSGSRLQSCRASDGFKFRKESGLVYWRLGDVVLTKQGPPKPLLARFITEGEVRPGTAEARWEINGSLGSGVILSKLEESKGKEKEIEEDPFADEGDNGSQRESELWKDVIAIKKWRSGNYMAS